MEPLELLKMMVAWDITPQLNEEELTRLLEANRIVDPDGYQPQDANYVPTYDLNQAALNGWRLKMGKISSAFSFTISPSERYERQQIFDHCLTMVKEYQKLVQVSIPDAPVQRLGWY